MDWNSIYRSRVVTAEEAAREQSFTRVNCISLPAKSVDTGRMRRRSHG